MHGNSRPDGRQRVRTRTSRKTDQSLLVLGCLGLVVGVALLVLYTTTDNATLRAMGLAYLLIAVAVLAARRAITVARDENRLRREEHRRARPVASSVSASGVGDEE